MQVNKIYHRSRFQRRAVAASGLLAFLLVLLLQPLAGTPSPQDLVGAGQALFIPTQEGGGWREAETPFSGVEVHNLVRDLDDPHRFYAATEAGLFISQDAGEHWTKIDLPVFNAASEQQEASDAVLAVARVDGKLFAGTRRGLLVSRDEGQSWEVVSGGLTPEVVPLAIVVAASDSPVIYLGTARQGIFRSQDEGEHWRAINRGLPPAVGAAPVTPVSHLVIDPTESDTAYVATEVSGIYKTHNGGRSWRAVNDGLPGRSPYRTYPPLLAVHPQKSSVLYAVVGYPVHSHKIENKLYKSTDRAEHWEYVATLPDNVIFRSLAFSRENPNRLLIGYAKGVLTLVDDQPELSDLKSGSPHQPATGDLPPAINMAAAESDMDVGNIAVLHDDGSLLHLFDLNGRSIQFERVSNNGYAASFVPLAFDSSAGAPLTLGDNDFASVHIPFSFHFYSKTQTTVFVNANGNLTFNQGSRDQTPSPLGRLPRISALWTDLDPSQGGAVTVRSASDRLVITWNNVPEVGTHAMNTLQVTLFNNDRVVVSFPDVQSKVGLTGISQGLTLFPMVVDYTTDLPLARANFRPAIYEQFDGSFEINAIARRFYQTHPDEVDFLSVFGTSSTPYDVVDQGFAFYAPVQNNVGGIGASQGESNGGPSAFGSAGRLQGFLNMNKLSKYPDDPTQTFFGTNSLLDIMAQETGHRWMAFVQFADAGNASTALLGRDFAHWSFFLDTDASEMEGNDWQDNGNGAFTTIGATTQYSQLDRYLMGLVSPSEVSPFFLIKNPTDAGGHFSGSAPEIGVQVKGTRQNVTISQIIAQEGLRSPAFPNAPRSFNQAFILVVPQGESASSADLNKLENVRRYWEVFFNVATGGRGTINARLNTTSGADLLPANVGVSPSTISPGASLNINITIANQGNAVAGSAIHEIRLSDDSAIDSSDTLLATLATSSLAPGSSTSFSFTVAIPANATPGQKFIGIVADAGNAVAELNEANNVVLVPITVAGGGSGADFIPLNLSASPTTVPAGGAITVTVTISNQGSAVAPQATHEIRLSNDSNINRSDLFLTNFITGDLPPGVSVTFSITTAIPAGTAVGGKFIGVIADALQQVAESNEANNTASVFINVTQ
jgi:hypothetical protein